MKRIVILLMNQKGGVGKTTSCREIAKELARRGRKVLVIDCDPQGNLTKGLTDDEYAGTGLHTALTTDYVSFLPVSENLYLLGASQKLTALEKQLVGELDGAVRIKGLLDRPELQDFEFVFIDTPPSLNLLTANAMGACDFVIVPMLPAMYTLQGTEDLFEAFNKVKRTFNPFVRVLGILITMYDSRPVITREIEDEIVEAFEEKVFRCRFSKSVKIDEAVALKKSVFDLNPKSKSALEVVAITDEVLSRLEVLHGQEIH